MMNIYYIRTAASYSGGVIMCAAHNKEEAQKVLQEYVEKEEIEVFGTPQMDDGYHLYCKIERDHIKTLAKASYDGEEPKVILRDFYAE